MWCSFTYASPQCGMRSAECGMDIHPSIPHSEFRIPHSDNQDGHDLMRLRDEPHRLAPPLEHEGDRFALVGTHPMGTPHTLTESPCPRRLAIGRVVAPQDPRGAPLR